MFRTFQVATQCFFCRDNNASTHVITPFGCLSQETFYSGDVDLREVGSRCAGFWEAYLRKAHEDIQTGVSAPNPSAATTLPFTLDASISLPLCIEIS
jgi:hypothetical protein